MSAITEGRRERMSLNREGAYIILTSSATMFSEVQWGGGGGGGQCRQFQLWEQ